MSKRIGILSLVLVLAVASPAAEGQPLTMADVTDAQGRTGPALFYGGSVIRLIGYGDYGMVAEQSFAYTSFLNTISANGLNFTRVWVLRHWNKSLAPFAQCDAGQVNLEQRSKTFFARLRRFVAYASQRGIIVQVCILDANMLESNPNRWTYAYYNANNNCQNYLTSPADFNTTSGDVWTKVNKPLLRQVVRTLGNYSNVIYEVANEPQTQIADSVIEAAVRVLWQELNSKRKDGSPRYSGSKIISLNGSHVPAALTGMVQLRSVHINSPSQAAATSNDDSSVPIIISNDGDATCHTVAQKAANGGLADETTPLEDEDNNRIVNETDRQIRIRQTLNSAFPRNSSEPVGHRHFEFLDLGLNGSTWNPRTPRSEGPKYDYTPSTSNIDGDSREILKLLARRVVKSPPAAAETLAAQDFADGPEFGEVFVDATPLPLEPGDETYSLGSFVRPFETVAQALAAAAADRRITTIIIYDGDFRERIQTSLPVRIESWDTLARIRP